MKVNLHNICLDIKKTSISIVSSDGYILFFVQYRTLTKKELKITLPKESVNFLAPKNGILQIFENFSNLNFGDFEIIMKMDNLYKYPDYEKILPKEEAFVGGYKFEKMALIGALNNLDIVRFDDSCHTKIEISGNTLYISSIDYNKTLSFRTWVPVSGGGAHYSFTINVHNLIKALNELSGKFIELCFYKNVVLIALRDGERFIYLTTVFSSEP